MFARRENEPAYALLNDKVSKAQNIYGKNIETVNDSDPRRDQPLNINNDEAIGENPNRYKQHGFYFNADNCIACHACEAACSEKNDNPAHIAFRSVGFIEGGTYPAYQRLNISMACNHCDDPVCLKGCPTRAYTKFAEYGAVLQDHDICFGCGYCTWVCPYNAPQLDPVEGQVTKCNMCVDRLEVGLKPACVSACLGNALDFGVIENIPENRTQAKTEIPGFPRTDITHPNIRFQQTRTTQRDMYRVDNTTLKYHKDESTDVFKPQATTGQNIERKWNWKQLFSSHENAHIVFTLLTQMVMGGFLIMLGSLHSGITGPETMNGSTTAIALAVMWVLQAFGLYKLNMHLGKPHRFYRGFYNLRHSPVSREIAGISLFFAGLTGALLFSVITFPLSWILLTASSVAAVAGAVFGGYFMYKLYRIEARPFWNHWHTASSFLSSALVLGSLILAFTLIDTGSLQPESQSLLLTTLLSGLVLEIAGLVFHSRDLKSEASEGAVSFHEQLSTYGKTYWLRNSLLVFSLALTTAMLTGYITGVSGWVVLACSTVLSYAISRALFFVLVIPTTMPGAFFWKNKGFVEHAREVGLADMPQMGVVHEKYHAFKLGELLETIRTTTMSEKLSQFKRVFTG